MSKQYKEGNVLLAEFMGLKFTPYNDNRSIDIEFNTYSECETWIKSQGREGFTPHLYFRCEFGEYHKSWGWLMNVVEKIEAIKEDGVNWEYCVTIERDYCVISQDGEAPIIEVQGEGNKLETVYEAVVGFIKLYNENI